MIYQKLSEEEDRLLEEQFSAVGKQLSDFMVRVVKFKARFEKRVSSLSGNPSGKSTNLSFETQSSDSNVGVSQAERCLEEASLFLKRLMDVFDCFFDPNYAPGSEIAADISTSSGGRNSSILIIEEHFKAQKAEQKSTVYLFIAVSALFSATLVVVFVLRMRQAGSK